MADIDPAGQLERRVASFGLRQVLQIPARAKIQRQARRHAELILREQPIGRHREYGGALAERLEVELECLGGHIIQAAKAIFSLRGVDEIVGVMVDVQIESKFERVAAENPGQVIRHLVPAVASRKLEPVAAQDETGVGVLNRCRGHRGRRAGQIRVRVVGKMKAQLIVGHGTERGLHRKLEEMAGVAIRE